VILADTSVWVDYFRGKEIESYLSKLLSEERIVLHPWVVGELMLGFLKNREQVLRSLDLLPKLNVYEIQDLIDFVESEKLYGLGLSLIDVQLLYASLIEDCPIWTLDRQLLMATKRYNREFILEQ
jgi:predicted nucleic acid-binding protein